MKSMKIRSVTKFLKVKSALKSTTAKSAAAPGGQEPSETAWPGPKR